MFLVVYLVVDVNGETGGTRPSNLTCGWDHPPQCRVKFARAE